MSRISKLFARKNKKVLNIYCTAGYPEPGSTLQLVSLLGTNGADMIELGMPYSDPLADGPVIQASSSVSIRNGMNIQRLFEQLKDLRDDSKNPALQDLPIILMGYMNPVMQYGFERFCEDAARVGIDGLILPDLPVYEFETTYGPVIKTYGLDFIFLVTPETSEERIRKLDALSSGFIYAVSSSSTTGSSIDPVTVGKYLEKLKIMQLKNPVLAGFGISDQASFEAACRYANGAIIGSAFIKALENNKSLENSVKQFMNSVLGR